MPVSKKAVSINGFQISLGYLEMGLLCKYTMLYYRVYGASPVAQIVRICLQCGESRFNSCVGKIPWRRGQPTPVFLPGEFHSQRSLAGYSPGGCQESNMTERLIHMYRMFRFAYIVSVTTDIKISITI